MKKLMMIAGVGFAICMLPTAARAESFIGGYTYKLVLRGDYGFALSGGWTSYGNESVTANYKIEVYNANGETVYATLADESLVSGNAVGYNCTLAVSVGDAVGYAKIGEQLTLVVTTRYDGTERFRSSKVLPPVGGSFGFSKAPVGVFFGAEGDTDDGWSRWRANVGNYIPEGAAFGGPDDDYDGDGLSNMCEYQLGTDPVGGDLGLMNGPDFKIEEQDGGYKVSFNCDMGHIYSIRVIEGSETVGRDGLDLALYESPDSLSNDAPWGTYFYNADCQGGKKEFFVRKPELEKGHVIGLAVDGRLQQYIRVSSQLVEVTPGFPIEYDTEAAAAAAKAIAEITPSEAVQGVLTGVGAVDVYKAAFTVEVRQGGDNWLLLAELTPEAQTNLAANATDVTRQIPVAEIGALSTDATMSVSLTNCVPGFYYSLHSGAAVTNITADAEAENLGILCDAEGRVLFPKVKKPGEDAGFFKVVISEK